MMFPSAVEGHMPFVDRYKQEQINKVIRKADRQRRHSGGSPMDSAASRAAVAKETKGRSMPALSHFVNGSQRPRFISMPEMAAKQTEVQAPNTSNGRLSLLSSLKRMFGLGKPKGNKAVSVPPTSAAVKQLPEEHTDGRGRRVDRVTVTVHRSRKVLVSAASTGDAAAHSCKRPRVRTVSNISNIMETIVEQNESTCSREHLSSGDEDAEEDESGSSSADSSGRGSSGRGGSQLPSGDGDSSTEGYDSS